LHVVAGAESQLVEGKLERERARAAESGADDVQCHVSPSSCLPRASAGPVIQDDIALGALPSRQQYELAEEVLAEERLLRPHDVSEREGLGEDRADLAPLDIADKVGEHLRLQDGAAQEAQILQIKGAKVELDDRPGDCPG